MGALLCFARPGLTLRWGVEVFAATRRGERACLGATGSSCGTAPSRGCGGRVKAEAGAETSEPGDSVDVVKWRPWCSSARCLSACDSCDGSCGVEGQQLEEGRLMRRSIARVSASTQGLFCENAQEVRTHIVQDVAQQGERLGVGHCAQLEFRKLFHDGVAACLTR